MVWPQGAPGWTQPLPTEPQRPEPVQTLMAIAGLLADRSTCPRGAVGCVIADARGYVLTSGYNGAPGVGLGCAELGCLIEGGHCVRAMHAEARAVAAAARNGAALGGSWAYVTVRPCLRCTYTLIEAGVEHIRYYHRTGSEEAGLAEVTRACLNSKVSLYCYHGEDLYGLLRYRQSPKAAE